MTQEQQLHPGDSELIAAFIDRRLPEAERRAFMARLDNDPALYEVFVETVRFREAHPERVGDLVRHPAAARDRTWMIPATVAAVLALAVGSMLWLRDGLGQSGYAQALVADGALEEQLDGDWHRQDWQRFRGGPRPSRDATQSAFRVGVHALDLEIALRTGRVEAARTLLRGIDFELGGVDLSEPLASEYAAIARQLESSADAEAALEAVERLDPTARETLDLGYGYSFGRWAEAGRLAARSGNRALLGARDFRSTLEEVRTREWPEEIRERLDAVRAALGERSSEPDFDALETAFKAIIDAS